MINTYNRCNTIKIANAAKSKKKKVDGYLNDPLFCQAKQQGKFQPWAKHPRVPCSLQASARPVHGGEAPARHCFRIQTHNTPATRPMPRPAFSSSARLKRRTRGWKARRRGPVTARESRSWPSGRDGEQCPFWFLAFFLFTKKKGVSGMRLEQGSLVVTCRP